MLTYNERASRAAKALVQSGALTLTKAQDTTARNAFNKKFNSYRAKPSAGGRFSPALQRTGASRNQRKPGALQRSPSSRTTAEESRWRLFSRNANRTKTYTKPPAFYKMAHM